MRKILVTGGTVFVSRFIAEYYVAKGDEVYVLRLGYMIFLIFRKRENLILVYMDWLILIFPSKIIKSCFL